MDFKAQPANHPSSSQYASQYAAQIKGKTVLVTGASPQSLAHRFLLRIAAHGPKELILAGRSSGKLEEAAAELKKASSAVKTRSLIIDLESLDSARKAAAEVNSWSDVPHIDVLVLNAGIMAVDFGLTQDGFERTFAVDHLTQFLFANLIMPKVLSSPDKGRVVVVSSAGSGLGPVLGSKDDINFQGGKTYNRWEAYGQAKTANILFALGLVQRLGSKGLQAYSLHPGAIGGTGLTGHVSSEQWANFEEVCKAVRERLGPERTARSTINTTTTNPNYLNKFKSMEDGAATHVVASFDPTLKAEWSGGFLQDGHLDREGAEAWATDPKEADRVWALSEDFVGQKFVY